MHTEANSKEGDQIGAMIVAPRKDADAIAEKKVVTKDAGIHYGLNPGNDVEFFLTMGMHHINNRSFHNKAKTHYRCFNCGFSKCYNNVALGEKTSQNYPFLIMSTAPIKAGTDFSIRCRNDE